MMALSNSKDAPRADPHAGCCGSRGRKAPGDPIQFMPSAEAAAVARAWARAWARLPLPGGCRRFYRRRA
jgi:hypothetical protein